MKSLLNRIFKPKQMELKIPQPTAFPNRDNVVEWMNQKAAYFAQSHPEILYTVFSPSWADYIPLNVIVGTSQKAFNEHYLSVYRELKAKYPDAVKEAKAKYSDLCVSRVGDNEDFPK